MSRSDAENNRWGKKFASILCSKLLYWKVKHGQGRVISASRERLKLLFHRFWGVPEMFMHVTPYAWRLQVPTQQQLLHATEDILLVKGDLVVELTNVALQGVT